MNEKGTIIKIVDDKTAKVKMKRHSACAACGRCKPVSSESKDIVVEVDNSFGAKLGDCVEISMENINVLKAVAIAYVIPLIALMVGIIVPYNIITKLGINVNAEVVSAIIGILLTVISYLVIKLNNKKFRDSRNYIPVITRIIIDL